ncbi:MAG: TonB family protein [Candidatus Sulfotelmatobacter sp.]
MALRCLLFSSHEETVQPIWQVLADLGIEGEYCKSAVDAVEKVTTQVFQIVITDWDDQPEAGFLLKTARELKAAQRPLTLAIVSDDARLPEALQAGANSVLVKPIRVEQVRDTMSTACELLRAKQQPGTLQAAPAARREATEIAAFAAAAAAGTASAPSTVTQGPEKAFRAGEFLQSSGSAPGGQFDTENEIHKSMEQSAAAEVDALTELEPMASAVEAPPAPEPEPQEPLTGWAALQARLTKTAPPPPPEEAAPEKIEIVSYGETPSFAPKPAAPAEDEIGKPAKAQSHQESAPEAALFAYISQEKKEESEPPAREPRPILGKILVVGIAAACIALVAVPRSRQTLRIAYRNAVRAGVSWLNPPPAPVAQAAPQHDSFGEAGDEYKLPSVPNIPDATTDPSQIRVLPVIDPTAKPQKGADANGGQATATTRENGAADPNQANSNQTNSNQAGQNQISPNPTDQPSLQNAGGQAQVGVSQVKDPAPATISVLPGNTAEASPAPSSLSPGPAAASATTSGQSNAPVAAPVAPPRPAVPPAQSSAPPQTVPVGNSGGIPSSLKSQIASSTPDASGAMPVEAAMSSIEPVNLPESAAWGLLAQPVDPVYPDAAKASGQKGSVVLQVLIGRDGAVKDAKFLQGSLVFARAAIDAVKQWRFKPYSMNGRAVSVQSIITLNFKPPA